MSPTDAKNENWFICSTILFPFKRKFLFLYSGEFKLELKLNFEFMAIFLMAFVFVCTHKFSFLFSSFFLLISFDEVTKILNWNFIFGDYLRGFPNFLGEIIVWIWIFKFYWEKNIWSRGKVQIYRRNSSIGQNTLQLEF